MPSEHQSGEIRHLASALALVGGYYAIRASLKLPAFHEYMANMDVFLPPWSVSALILNHHHAFLACVIAVLITTLLAIWVRFKNHKFIYTCGILLLFILADRAISSILDPILLMISNMGSQ